MSLQAGDHLKPTSYSASADSKADSFIKPQHELHREHFLQQFFHCFDHVTDVSHCLAMGVFAEQFPSNSRLSGSAISPLRRHITICNRRFHKISGGGVWRQMDVTVMIVCLFNSCNLYQQCIRTQWMAKMGQKILRITTLFVGNIICPVSTPTWKMDSVPLLRWAEVRKGNVSGGTRNQATLRHIQFTSPSTALQCADAPKWLLSSTACGDTQLLLSHESVSEITSGSSSCVSSPLHVSPCDTFVTSPSKCFPLLCVMTFWNSLNSALIRTALCRRHHTALCYHVPVTLGIHLQNHISWSLTLISIRLTVIPITSGLLIIHWVLLNAYKV
jgi:hypothetical protein